VPFKPEDDKRKVAIYLGLSPDTALQGFDEDMPPNSPEWQGWRHRRWGVLSNWNVELDGPPQWPAIARRPLLGGEWETYQIWLEQMYHPALPIAAERRWHPDLGTRDAIVGLEGDRQPSGEQLIAARRAFVWLRKRQVREQGRHAGDGERWESNDESIADINAAIDDGCHSALSIADRVGASESTIYRRVKNATRRPLSAHVISRNSMRVRQQ
jgi:hypothetical protein